jgi:putative transposase
MPYEYRKLSPDERKEIVETRKQRGFPMHAPPHPYREAGIYLLTAANFEHQPVMAEANRRTEFEQLLLEELRKIEAEFIGWVVLPNHYHVLLSTPSLDPVSQVIQRIHGSTSYQ